MKKQETRTKINDKHQSRVSMTFRGQKTTSTQKSLIFQWPANSETAIRGQNMPSSVKRGAERFANGSFRIQDCKRGAGGRRGNLVPTATDLSGVDHTDGSVDDRRRNDMRKDG